MVRHASVQCGAELRSFGHVVGEVIRKTNNSVDESTSVPKIL